MKNETFNYQTAEKMDYCELEYAIRKNGPSPLTVHFPIHPPFSPDFIYVDSALNVGRHRVYPDMSVRDPERYRAVKKKETFALQFAFGEIPFVPDFRQSRMKVPDKSLPLIEGEYFAWDTFYRVEYANAVIDGANLIGVRVSVVNEGEKKSSGAVWVKLNYRKEEELFDYHYIPFYWDNTKYKESPSVSRRGNCLCKNGIPVAVFQGTGFAMEFIERKEFPYSAQNAPRHCEAPYFVTRPMHLNSVFQTMRMGFELVPGKSECFEVVLFADFENPPSQSHLIHSFEEIRAAAENTMRSTFPKELTQLSVPGSSHGDVFSSMHKTIMQMLVHFNGESSLFPTQGGSSERHFTWVWEAVAMVRPLLKTGCFAIVQRVLEQIFSLQDGGCPPEGRFSSLKGAVGTTGQRWANSTGSALLLAAEYYLYSRDEHFLNDYLDKMFAAANWIIGEIQNTRKRKSDGTRPAWYGLMPFCQSTDGRNGYVITFTDAWSFFGLKRFGDVLLAKKDVRASRIRTETEQYGADIVETMKFLRRADGYISPQISTGDPEESLWVKSDNITGCIQMFYCGVADTSSELLRDFMTYFESHSTDSGFCGNMDREVVYIGPGELNMQSYYLAAGEWKKAWLALEANLLYGMTADSLLTQERFSRFNSAFTCWQPNGSGSGRIIEMLLNAIAFEHGDALTLLGGIKPSTDALSLRGLRLGNGGILDLRLADRKIELFINSVQGLKKIRIPEMWNVTGSNVHRLNAEDFEAAGGIPVVFELGGFAGNR